MPALNFVWDGRPSPRIGAEYRVWMMTVVQELANRWRTKIAWAFGVSPTQTELWGFEPGKAPELLEKCGGMFE
jgi:hypothetical protein